MTSNGYFSFGRQAQLYNPVLFPESDFYNNLVVPFWAKHDLQKFGMISYEVHSELTSLMSIVNNFIQQVENEEFVGSWMMIVTFNEIPLLSFTNNEVRLFACTIYLYFILTFLSITD